MSACTQLATYLENGRRQVTRPGGSAETLPNRGAVGHSKNNGASGRLPLKLLAWLVATRASAWLQARKEASMLQVTDAAVSVLNKIL
jgi:hypothetical protein